MDIDIAQRVKNGIVWLDAYGPKDWRSKIAAAIKRRRFDISDPAHCALGEVYGDFNDACIELGIDDPDVLGFETEDCSDLEVSDEYHLLTAEWKRLYRKGQRQAATKLRR